MQVGEEEHLSALDRVLGERRVRPSVLVPLWKAAGFALGAASALAGKTTAMAVTVAVETAIAAHYNDQVRTLIQRSASGNAPAPGADAQLAALFTKHRDEETAHHDTAVAQGARDAPGFAIINAVVLAGCKAAIAVAKRI
jgi:ubiquinone biosynthesis monooxygenase Coq7